MYIYIYIERERGRERERETCFLNSNFLILTVQTQRTLNFDLKIGFLMPNSSL